MIDGFKMRFTMPLLDEDGGYDFDDGRLKKSVRIPTEIRYVTNRDSFTIGDLMTVFNISRQTAVRDLHDIESQGIAVVPQAGYRDRYMVKNRKNSLTVQLHQDEIAAIFVSFLASLNDSLPYLKSRQSLVEKLLSNVSEKQRHALLSLQQVLTISNESHADTGWFAVSDQAPVMLAPLIDEISYGMGFATIMYRKKFATNDEQHHVYVRIIFQQSSLWYVDTWDLTRQAKRTFRVDRIQSVAAYDLSQVPELMTPPSALETTFDQATNVQLRLGPTAIQRFQEFRQPTDTLGSQAQYETTVDLADERELSRFVDWLLYLGDDVEIVKLPKPMWRLLRQKGHRFDEKKS
jgi:predicted DNA-binding transcriptional regulator YafY